MADTLFPQAREVVLSELLTNGKRATYWVDRGAFRALSMESWWEAVSAAGEGWRQNDIRVFGQWYKEPRLTAWWGPA